jgi:hypothetical protein
MSARIKSDIKLRMEIAEVAARLIAVEGMMDFHSAKRKAALQLGFSPNRSLPSNQEIEQALINYQNLFQSDTQKSNLRALRKQAVQAMKMLRQFRPLLVGPVATGTATNTSDITLHLYFDQVEQVGLFLAEQGIPYTLTEKNIKINAKRSTFFPAYNFIADKTSINLVIFSEKDKNLNPLSSTDNKPMFTANLQETLRMIEHGREPTQ